MMLSRWLILMIALMILHTEVDAALASPSGQAPTCMRQESPSGRPRRRLLATGVSERLTELRIQRGSSLPISSFRVPRGGMTARSGRWTLGSFGAPVTRSFVPSDLDFASSHSPLVGSFATRK
jgi:hypothetical protein